MRHSKKKLLVDPDYLERVSSSAPDIRSTGKISHPNVKRAAKVKTALNDIVTNRSLSDFDKVLKYSSNIQRYLANIKSALTTSKASAVLGEEVGSHSSPVTHPPTTPSGGQSAANSPQTPVSQHLDTSETPSTSNVHASFLSPRVSVTPYTSFLSPPHTPVSKKRQQPRRNASKFSIRNIVGNLSSTDSTNAERVLEIIDVNPDITWNRSNGEVHIKGRPLRNANIVPLLQDYLLKEPKFSQYKPYRSFAEIVDRSLPPSTVGPEGSPI